MSHRAMIWLLGVLAGGLALLGRFGGLYQNWDIHLQNHLFSPMGPRGLPLWVEILGVLLFGFGTALVGLEVKASKFRVGLVLAILLQPISAVAVGVLVGRWVSPFAWLVAIVSALLGVLAYRFSHVGKRERMIRDIFGRNVSESSLARLLQQPDSLVAKASQATVLSARYLGQEGSRVEKLAQHLRLQSAWVELQAGNRLVAVWDMPLALATAAEKAVESTLEISADWQVGVATGEITGEVLSSTHHWQMQGAAFEKANALCQANVTFGSQALLDLTTADLVRQAIVLRPVDFLVLPAAELGVEIFQPLALANLASPAAIAQRDCFWEAVIFFRQKRFAEALTAFQKSGNDAVVQYYLRRLEKITPAC